MINEARIPLFSEITYTSKTRWRLSLEKWCPTYDLLELTNLGAPRGPKVVPNTPSLWSLFKWRITTLQWCLTTYQKRKLQLWILI